MNEQTPFWERWRYCEMCDYEWKPGEFDASCKGCGGCGELGRRVCAEENYGSCGRCGCNLTDPSEAMDGVCDQCSWWMEQSK